MKVVNLMKSLRRVLVGMVLVIIGQAPVGSGAVPDKAGEVIEWVGEAWTEEGWDASLKNGYMRRYEDRGWRTRMIGMQTLVRMGADAVGALVETLKHGEPGMRIFSAQTLGFLGPRVLHADLVAALGDEEASVRLYAVDALGMSGADGLEELLGPMRKLEKDGDVKKHIGYALLREGAVVREAVIASLLAWDPKTIDSAEVGEMAPDFELTALTGETIRLSDFRGQKAVVLVFIYGDT